MSQSFKTFLLAGGFAAASTVGASAAVLDFTDLSSYDAYDTSSATGSITVGTSSVGWTLTPNMGDLHVDTSPDAAAGTGGLVLDTDGVGIKSSADTSNSDDDEITNGLEQLFLTFDKLINVTSVSVLDLFFSSTTGKTEVALAYDDSDNSLIVSIGAADPLGAASGGYATESFAPYAVSSIRFEASGAADDPTTTFDFALAAVGFDDSQLPPPIPLPAGGLLLLGGLAGLAAMRRRTS